MRRGGAGRLQHSRSSEADMGRRPNLQLIQLISREVYTDPFVLCMTQNKMLIYVADRTHAYQKKILDEHEKN